MADGTDPADFTGRAERQVDRIRQQVRPANRKDLLILVRKGKQGKLPRSDGWAASTVTNNARNARKIAAELEGLDSRDGKDDGREGRDELPDRILDCTPEELNNLLLELSVEKKWSDGTERGYAMTLRNLFQAHGREKAAKQIEYPAVDHTTSPIDEKSVMTREELMRMIETADHPRNKAMLAVLWESGCRETALASLKIRHYDPRESYAILRLPGEHVEGLKRAAHDAKPLTFSVGYLDRWLNEHPAADDEDAALFCGLRDQDDPHEHLHSHTIYKTIKRIARETEGVNADYVTAHAFKHGRGTEMRASDEYGKEDIEVVMDWAEGTPLHQRYEHVESENEALRILRKRGIEVDEQEPVAEEIDCPRCSTCIPVEANYCPTCGLRPSDEPPRWWRIYRSITSDNDPVRVLYEEDLPPPSVSGLTPDVFEHAVNRLLNAMLATANEALAEKLGCDTGRKLDREDAKWVYENVPEAARNHRGEYPIAHLLRQMDGNDSNS